MNPISNALRATIGESVKTCDECTKLKQELSDLMHDTERRKKAWLRQYGALEAKYLALEAAFLAYRQGENAKRKAAKKETSNSFLATLRQWGMVQSLDRGETVEQ